MAGALREEPACRLFGGRRSRRRSQIRQGDGPAHPDAARCGAAEGLRQLDRTAHRQGQVWRLLIQKIEGGTSIVARAADRLRDFVSQRGGQFSHHAQAVHVGEI